MVYNYVAFKDEAGKVYIVRDLLLKSYSFGGSAGKITEIERGVLEKREEETGYLRAITRKRKELENVK